MNKIINLMSHSQVMQGPQDNLMDLVKSHAQITNKFDGHNQGIGHNRMTGMKRKKNSLKVKSEEDVKNLKVDDEDIFYTNHAFVLLVDLTHSHPHILKQLKHGQGCDSNQEPASECSNTGDTKADNTYVTKHNPAVIDERNVDNHEDIKDEIPEEFEESKDDIDFEEDTILNDKKQKLYKNIYKCGDCSFEAPVLQSVHEHRKTHTEDKQTPYGCRLCNVSFSTLKHLISHLEMHIDNNNCDSDNKPRDNNNNNDNNYQCTVCKYKCAELPRLEMHVIRSHPPVQQYTCKRCDYTTQSTHSYTKHIKTHPGYEGYECEECPFKTDRSTAYHIHKREHKPFHCQLCDAKTAPKYPNKINLVHHIMATHIGDKTFQCSVCKYQTGIRSDLTKHVKIHSEGTHVCVVCGYKAQTAKRLREHMQTHTGHREFECTICDAKFAIRDSLRLHMRRHNNDRPYVCETCDRGFICSEELRSHVRIHSDIRAFKCTQCDYSCKQASGLRLHVNRHHTVRPLLTCSLCPYQAYENAILTKHMKRHEREVLQCDICNYSTVRPNYFKSHMKKHLGVTDVKCPHCPAMFLADTGLKSHITKSHSDIKPYQCEVPDCSFTCKHPSQLGEHLREEHADVAFKYMYICAHCAYTTPCQSTLEKHIRKLHRVDQPFKCGKCSYCAKNEYGLAVHMKTHMVNNQYDCDQCEYTTSKFSSLKLHLAKHRGDLPFKCDVCSFSTGYCHDFKVHKRNNHKLQLYE